MKLRFALYVIYILAGVLFSGTTGYSGTSTEALNQYISDLQKNPNDNALREKIIKHVQTMEPKPSVSEEARKYLDRGMAAAEDAKNEKDFRDAADEFQKAVNIAPWLGAGYRGLAVTQDKSGQYQTALQNLKLFLLTNPSAEDAEKAKTLRNKIEYRMERAAKESSQTSIAEKKQNEYETWLKKLDGRKYRDTRGGPAVIEVRGKTLVVISPGLGGGIEVLGPWEIKGRIATTPRVMQQNNFLPVQEILSIVEDGDRIIQRREFSDGDMREYVWIWQR